jgi:hypothetical protein
MAVAERTKLDLDQLRQRESELAEKVEATRSRLSEYSTLIAAARRDAVYAGRPRPGGELGGSVRTLTDNERKDATALVGLEGDLSAIRSVIAEEAARLAEEDLAEARKQIAELHKREELLWTKAGEVFAELAGVWNQFVEIAEQEDAFASTNGLVGSGVLSVEPAPATFKAFLLLLLTASTDAEVRAEPVTEQLADIGAFGRRDEHGNDLGGAVYDVRPAGTKTVEVRRRLDDFDRLFSLTPDLRSVVRALRLSGHVPTIES